MTILRALQSAKRGNLIIPLAMAACVFALPLQAIARPIAIDFGNLISNNGQNFSTNSSADACAGSGPASCELDLTGNGTSSPISIGFDINFGGGPVSQLAVSENGTVSFGASVINVFNTDLASIAPTGGVFALSNGEILFSRGFADPLADGSGNYSAAEALAAFHATWYGLTDSSGNAIFAQMLLYNQGDGNFDLRLRYGLNNGDSYAIGPNVAGFNLGSNVLSLTSPLVTTTDYFYSFRDGRLQTSNSVPEPGTMALLSLGLLTVVRRRKFKA